MRNIFIPVNFEHAYEYLAYIDINDEDIDWELLKDDIEVYSDILLLRTLHIAKSTD